MPLTINNGPLIDLQPSNPPAGNRLVNITHHFQEGRQWCWAACIQMVLELTGVEMSQCEIVKLKLNDPNHQCGPDFQSRNDSCEPEQMAPAWRDCGIQNAQPVSNFIPMQDIKTEIAANRAIQVGIFWLLGSGHAVLIKGWAPTSPETLLIDDPLRESPLEPDADGSGRATHDELVSAFGHGQWVSTWKHLD